MGRTAEPERDADEETLDLDAGEFARAREDEAGSEAGLGAGGGFRARLAALGPDRDEGNPA